MGQVIKAGLLTVTALNLSVAKTGPSQCPNKCEYWTAQANCENWTPAWNEMAVQQEFCKLAFHRVLGLGACQTCAMSHNAICHCCGS
eukprot:4622522-Amphidinium_carterae.1